MRFIDEFRDGKLAESILKGIKSDAHIKLMEVCGTHTVAMFKFGIKKLLPENIEIIAGPGCPVCVTPQEVVDKMVEYARMKDVIIATFGDMMKVPGTYSSLVEERSKGADVRIVYSVQDALKIARDNPGKEVVFLGVGFETTAPSIAVAIKKAKEEGLRNFLVLSAHKTIPEVLEALASSDDLKIMGFILPGHVSTIIGMKPYLVLTKYRVAGVISGFEPVDILLSIKILVDTLSKDEFRIENEYRRSVRYEGNPKALKVMWDVFEPCHSNWRGIGVIPGSGLKIRKEFSEHDAEKVAPVNPPPSIEPEFCLCGEILKGSASPPDCPLFGKNCTPETPVGPCMVSSEGTCSAYFKYGG